VLAALAKGVNLVAEVTRDGAEVDAWTLDADRPGLRDALRQLVTAGVAQITTNDPELLAPVLREMVAAPLGN
jgi:glycerophosphoryl diester phosphodiesterase